MNAKYAVTDEIRTWADYQEFKDQVNAARSRREISEYEWEELLDLAAEQVKASDKQDFLSSVPSTGSMNCPDGHPTVFKGIKKNKS
jgi:hypothetical protein